MAETALSMARSMLGRAISKAVAAASEELSLLMGVQKEIWFMKDELETMQAFLIAAEAMKNKDLLLKVWTGQVRNLSYDVEDCLDEFMVHVGSRSLSQQLMKLKDRHRIAIRIRNLKSRMEDVSSRNTRYTLIRRDDTATHIDEAESRLEDVRGLLAGNIDEAKLMGFAAPKKKLLDMINAHGNDNHARVICVVGMGGLGKTTLVRKIYESKVDIAKDFSCCAWIIVSQSLSRIEMLKSMIRGFFGNEALNKCLKELEGKELKVEGLGVYLRNELKEKRYFLVVDDLWNIGDWHWIRDISLPSSNNKASRVIITTRDAGLAEMCTTKVFIYHLEPLEEEYAIDLLLMKTRKTKGDMENDEKLKATVKQLVKKCGYLPLAILTIGALFATKPESEWDKLYLQLPSELETNLSLEAIKKMVMLSYNHLPSHLKPCFLYLSIFPEDFEIKRSHLVERWIAEGLIVAQVGMTIDEVGIRCFDELVSRSMIVPSRINIEGVVKRCRLHDIMRDIIISVAREENFVYTTRDNVPSAVGKNFRHVSYTGGVSTTTGMSWSCVRSLTFFGDRPIELAPSLCLPQLRMLRALDLENADFAITQKEVNNIGLLRHLKYLSASRRSSSSYSYIYALPKSIGKLQGLQVLDIRDSHISTVPKEISKLKSLRILRFRKRDALGPMDCLVKTLLLPILFLPSVDSEYREEIIAELYMSYSSPLSITYGVRFPRGIGALKELRILEVMDIKRTSTKAIEELAGLIRLRKLYVTTHGATEKKCMVLCKVIQKLPSLRSLHVDAECNGTVEWLGSASSLPSLRSLELWGLIGDKVDWFGNLIQLVKLELRASRLVEGKTLEILGALPNLRHLYLGYDTYDGNQILFRQGAFLTLQYLCIWYLENLREVAFEQDTSPHLETITIGQCQLESGINGIRHLPELKEIFLRYKLKVSRLLVLQEEVNAHPNKPVLRLEEDQSKHDLGDTDGPEEFFEAVESIPDYTEEGSQAITQTASDS